MTSLASTNQMIRRESAARENCYGAVPREHLLLEETSYKHKPPEQNIHRSSNTYHTEHRRHCTNMIKCFWQRKPQKKCSIAQGTLSNHYKLLGANHVFAKEQDKGQVKLIPQNSTVISVIMPPPLHVKEGIITEKVFPVFSEIFSGLVLA